MVAFVEQQTGGENKRTETAHRTSKKPVSKKEKPEVWQLGGGGVAGQREACPRTGAKSGGRRGRASCGTEGTLGRFFKRDSKFLKTLTSHPVQGFSSNRGWEWWSSRGRYLDLQGRKDGRNCVCKFR